MGLFEHPVIDKHEAEEIQRHWQYLVDRPSRDIAYELAYAYTRDGDLRFVIDVPKGSSVRPRRQLAEIRDHMGTSRDFGRLTKFIRHKNIGRSDMYGLIAYWHKTEYRRSSYNNLGAKFLTVGLGVALVPGALTTFDLNFVRPIMPPDVIAAWARQYLTDRNLEKLVIETVPPVVILFASFSPVGAAGGLTYILVNALIGFTDYLYTVYAAESDGTITEQEEAEAFWAILGIFPFRIVELIVTGQALLALGQVFISVVVDLFQTLIKRVEVMVEAIRNDWDQGTLFDAEHSVFVPNFALNDIRNPDAS